MNAFDLRVLFDQTSLWMFNVLIHVTILTSLALVIALLLRNRAAMRYWVLCFGLILVFISPVIAFLIQTTGGGLLTLQSNQDQVSMSGFSTMPGGGRVAGEAEIASQPEFLQSAAKPTTIPHETHLDATFSIQTSRDEQANIDRESNSVASLAVSNREPATTTPRVWRAFAIDLAVAIVMFVWGMGAFILLARMLFNWIRMARILRDAKPISDPSLQLAFDRACLAAACNQDDGHAPQLVSSGNITGPIAAGVFRGTVVLPESLVKTVSAGELIDVLVHEVAHVVRRDQIVVLIQNMVAALFWLHPLVRKLNRELARAREEVCDNFVLAATDAPTYSRTLLELAQLVSRHEPFPGCVGFFTSHWKLEDRVTGLLDAKRDRTTLLGRRGRLFVGLTAVVLASLTWMGTVRFARAQDGEGKTAQVETAVKEDVDSSNKETWPADEIPASRPNEPMAEVFGIVVDEDETPVGSATISVRLSFKEALHSFKTNDVGKFKFSAPNISLENMLILASNSDQSLQTSHRVAWEPEPKDYQSLRLKLLPSRSFVVEVKDQAGQVVPDVSVGCINQYSSFANAGVDENGRATLQIPSNLDVGFLFAFSQSSGMDYRSYVLGRDQSNDKNAEKPEQPNGVVELTLATPTLTQFKVTVKDTKGRPVVDSRVYPWLLKKPDQSDSIQLSCLPDLVSSRTDENGVATFAWIPDWPQYLTFWSQSNDYTHERIDIKPNSEKRELEIAVSKRVAVNGRVKLANGSPAAGLCLRFHGRGLRAGESSGSSDVAEVYTGDDGEFEIKIAPHQAYLGFSKDKKLKFDSPVVFVVGDSYEGEKLDLTVRPGTRVFGRVGVTGSNQPVTHQYVVISQSAEREIPIQGGEGTYFARTAVSHGAKTDENGEFEFVAGAGDYSIRGSNQSDPIKLTVADQEEVEVNFELEHPPHVKLAGTVSDTVGKALAGVKIVGVYAASHSGARLNTSTDDQGQFEVERESFPVVIHARTEDGELAAIIELGIDDSEAEIELVPTTEATGRLVDGEGQPIVNKKIRFGRTVFLGGPGSTLQMSCFGDTVTSDKNGRFKLVQLVPGTTYHVSIVEEDEDGNEWRFPHLTDFIAGAEPPIHELGDLPYVKRVPYVPPTLEERIVEAFGIEGSPVERYDRALKHIKLSNQHLLIVFGKSKDPQIKRLMDIRFNDTEFRPFRDEFLFMAIPTDDERLAPSLELAEQIGEDLPESQQSLQLVIFDQSGEKVASKGIVDLTADGELSKDALFELLRNHLTQPIDARELLDEALKRAAQENKRVIVQETATWCSPCHLLSKFLDGNRVWEKDYVWIKMDHRWTGATEIMGELRGDADGGIPWFVILDAKGEKLATSNDPKSGDNIGFPSDASAQVHFTNMLNQTRQRMTEAEVADLIEKIDK